MKLTYHRCGDYLLPDLAIPDEPVVLGKYGRMRKTYLKEHKPIVYNTLLLSGKLTAHLVGVDAECRERLETLLPQMICGRKALTKRSKHATRWNGCAG